MKTNNFSYEKFVDIAYGLLFFMIVMVPISIFPIVLGCVSLEDGEKSFTFAMFMVPLFYLILLVIFFIYLRSGKRRYRIYAAQIINYDEQRTKVEDIKLTPDQLQIFYETHGEIHDIAITLKNYDIDVKVKKDCDVPTFLSKNGIFYRLIVPHVVEEDKRVWTEYYTDIKV